MLGDLLEMLRAAADPTRLRLLLLLSRAELTVSELTEILGQSQPRVSRHLKLLCDAGLIDRVKEGAWVFYRGTDARKAADLTRALTGLAGAGDEPALRADLAKLDEIRDERARKAATYFAANAAEWERIRALHVPEMEVENAILRLATGERLDSVLDAGTGTARILELLAPHV